MGRTDIEGAIFGLLGGFIVSAGLVGFVLAAGGYQLPTLGPTRPAIVEPAGAIVPAPALVAQPKTAPVAPVAQQALDVKIVATDLKFTPTTLQAKVGQPLRVTFENKGVIEHDLTFPTIKADKPASALKVVAKPGQTAALEFTPTAKGTYEYVCTIPGHKEAGMKGAITVSD
jgi:plastocyanin